MGASCRVAKCMFKTTHPSITNTSPKHHKHVRRRCPLSVVVGRRPSAVVRRRPSSVAVRRRPSSVVRFRPSSAVVRRPSYSVYGYKVVDIT